MAAETSVEIANERGLHARASAKFVKLSGEFDAEVTVSRDGQTVDARSIMGLMMLAAGPGGKDIFVLSWLQKPAIEQDIYAVTPKPHGQFQDPLTMFFRGPAIRNEDSAFGAAF